MLLRRSTASSGSAAGSDASRKRTRYLPPSRKSSLSCESHSASFRISVVVSADSPGENTSGCSSPVNLHASAE
eukprot:48616-Eustigmatos_ZCMA.PRE.1